jgi:hypothetical protein
MKRCIVCKRHHDRPDLFCDDHADLPNHEKLIHYKEYDRLVENASGVIDLEEFALVLTIPKRNAEGLIDAEKTKIFVNGNEMRANPPIYIKIDENRYVDMKINF